MLDQILGERALGEDHDLTAAPRIRFELGGRLHAEVARFGEQDHPVAGERVGVELLRIEPSVSAVDDIEREASLGERLGERQVLRMRLGPP